MALTILPIPQSSPLFTGVTQSAESANFDTIKALSQGGGYSPDHRGTESHVSHQKPNTETGAPVLFLSDVPPGTDRKVFGGGDNRQNKSDFSLEWE